MENIFANVGETSPNKPLPLPKKSLYNLLKKIKRLKFLFTSLLKEVNISSVIFTVFLPF